MPGVVRILVSKKKKKKKTLQEYVFILIPGAGIWYCLTAANYDLPLALARMWFVVLPAAFAIL